MKLSTDDRKKLLKWSTIGGSVFLVLLAGTLSIAFSGKYSVFQSNSSSSATDTNQTFEVVIGEDVPYLNIDKDLPQMVEEEELTLKETLWRYYQQDEIQEAAELILKEFKENQFSEESELYDWYIDLSLLNVLDQVSLEERTQALKNLRIPRLLAMNLAKEILILNVAAVIEDPVSLVPYAATNVLFEKETFIEDVSNWDAPSEHAEALKNSLQCVWEIDLTIDGESVTAIVGRMKATNKNSIIGFYGETDNFFTDEFIEERRHEFEQIPIFK